MKPGVVKILWIVYFLCVIPALVTLYHRAQFDKGFNSVALVADYVQLLELAQTENVPVDEILARVKDEAGIDHIALLEDTPIFLQQRGLCTIVEGVGWPGWKTPEERDEIEKNRGREVEEASAPELDFPLLMGLSHDKNHLIFEDHEVFARIAETAQERYPGLVDVTDLGDEGGIVSLAGEPKIVLEWGLGFDPDLVNHLEGRGFKLYPRLRDAPHYTSQVVGSILSQTYEQFGETVLIYDGDRILGYGAGQHRMPFDESERMRSGPSALDHMFIGWIEFAEQGGASNQAAWRSSQVVKVHSVEDEEMEVITPERAVDRYVRAVRERAVRLAYLKPFLLQTTNENIIEKTLSMFAEVRDSLEILGYKIGEPSTLGKNKFEVSGLVVLTFFTSLLLLSIGIFILLHNLGISIAPVHLNLIIASDLIVILIMFLTWWWPIIPKVLILAIALLSPMLAIVWLSRKYEDLTVKQGVFSLNPILTSIFYWFSAICITLAGAVCIAAVMINERTILAIDTFSGVKIALYLPILIAILIGVQLILPEGKRTIKDGIAWLLGVNIQIWHVILGIVGLALLFIMVDRSGNFPIIDVADWENNVRGWFETVLYARPRTKEMLFGHPGMIILMMLGFSSLKIRRALMYAGVVVGSVALTSMINTFCHFHTPILLSIWRTVGGLVIGGVIGLIAGAILLGLINLLSRKQA